MPPEKFKPKDLSYDKTLPPFLARLQNQHNRGGPETYQAPRATKARNVDEDAEDEPVYFDEVTNSSLTKEEWEAQEKERESGEDKVDAVAGGEAEGEKEKKTDGGEKEKAVIGASKKRKVGKVIGADEEGNDDAEKKKDGGIVKKSQAEGAGKKEQKVKGAKKAKKVKLSFGDDE